MLLLIVLLVAKLCVLSSSHPYENLTIVELIQLHNYPVEVHYVETADGYILTLQRIPHGVSNNDSKEVVLLTHGMGGGPENYVTLGPPDALAFYLSDRGYDVWLFNARGTAHSRKHKTLDPIADRVKFWNFSWHEIAVHDVSSTINYILSTTGRDKLSYVGHSQGTTTLFVLLSEIPEMNNKIKVAGLLAPSVLLNYTHSPYLQLITKLYSLAERLLKLLSWYELMIPNSPVLNDILKDICKIESATDICMDLMAIVGGTISGYMDKELLPAILHFSPSGFATRQVWHYAQIILSGEFKQYDFGEKDNSLIYNSTRPPFYDLASAKVPLGLFWAPQDHFANKKMTDELSKLLPNVVLQHEVKADAFSHLDYVFGNNVRQEVYEPLYALFKEFEDNL